MKGGKGRKLRKEGLDKKHSKAIICSLYPYLDPDLT